MNRLITLGLAAAFVVGGAGATLAEDAVAGAAGAVKSTTEAAAGTAVDATTTASIGTGSFGSLMTSLNAGASADLSAVTDASTVNFVTISALTDADPAALDAAIQSKTDAMASLHSSIEANAALKAKLEAAGYSSADVLAIETGADGAPLTDTRARYAIYPRGSLPYPADAPAPRALVLTPGWHAVPGAHPRGSPAGLAVARDGSIWIADDRAGAILRIARAQPSPR